MIAKDPVVITGKTQVMADVLATITGKTQLMAEAVAMIIVKAQVMVKAPWPASLPEAA